MQVTPTVFAARRTLHLPRPDREIVRAHVDAYVRSGALDAPECERAAIQQFARETSIGDLTAEFYWDLFTRNSR